MKKILLLSDTHGHIDDAVLKHAAQVDEVWHAGDIGSLTVTDALAERTHLRAVYGNIDDTHIRQEFPIHQRFHCEGVSVWMTHIGGYPPRYNATIRPQLQQNSPQLFVCGHSHILKVMPDKKLGLLHMNPGAIGKHGFHKARTMLRFVVDSGTVKDLAVVEYGW